jgi:hypothetical protein
MRRQDVYPRTVYAVGHGATARRGVVVSTTVHHLVADADTFQGNELRPGRGPAHRPTGWLVLVALPGAGDVRDDELADLADRARASLHELDLDAHHPGAVTVGHLTRGFPPEVWVEPVPATDITCTWDEEMLARRTSAAALARNRARRARERTADEAAEARGRALVKALGVDLGAQSPHISGVRLDWTELTPLLDRLAAAEGVRVQRARKVPA